MDRPAHHDHRAARKPRRTTALSLVEVLIVVVVLAIMATAAAPLLTTTAATQLRAAANLLIADLQLAQMESLSHPDVLCGVRFDTAAGRYSLVTDGAAPFNCSAATPITDPVRQEDYVTTFGAGRAATLAGVGIDSVALAGDECVVFGPLGELDQASAATIILRAGDMTLTVSVDPISGEATVVP